MDEADGATTGDGRAVDRAGRPLATSPRVIAAMAQKLFVEKGFAATSVADVTAAVGISQRTFFRYFSAKGDVLWVESAAELARFRAALSAADPDEPYQQGLLRAVLAAFTWTPADEQWARDRAQLVLSEPAVQGQFSVILSQWRAAAAEHARRQPPAATAEVAVVVGYAFVAGLLAANERWVSEPSRDLGTLLAEVLAMVLPAVSAP
ncbi:MAG: TetR family transcriptional regulator [Mycobacteriaceae bacterium]